MNEKIFTLKACDGTLRKSFFKEIEPLKVGTWFVPTEYEINELKEIYELIKVKRDKKENYCFIRGNCDMDKIENEGWRRLKANTYDEAKHWACLDIDELEVEEGEEYNAETLRQRLARDIDFIDVDTAMIIDFSSSAQLYLKGNEDKGASLWKAHVYLWFNEPISCKELHLRLKGYDDIDERTALVSQAIYFEEPYYDENLYEYALDKRTSFLSGKNARLPFRVLAKSVRVRHSNKISSLVDIKARTEAFYEEATKTGKRHTGLYRLFCHVIATQQPSEYWIDRYWNDANKSPDHDTKAKVYEVFREAKDYVYSTYLPQIEIGRHQMIELETNNVKKAIKKKVLKKGGVIIVKSPQSTYKTQLLKKIPKSASVLLISHRTALIRSICKELNLHIYEDNPINLETRNRLGITFDSLHKLTSTKSNGEMLTKREYDYVIIDESEQVISELLTTDRMEKSSGQRTSDVFYYVGQFIKKAKTVYCADADISDITRKFLEVWRTDNFKIYNNFWNEDGKNLFLLPSLNGTIEQIYEELENNKRVFITCETKIGARTTYEQIIMAFGKEKNILCITKDNSNKYKELLNNPNKEIPLLFNGKSQMNNGEFVNRNLDCLIVSPILTTGFSIGRLDDNENRFHTVIGIFNHYKKIYTGSDIRQSMRRVRNADTHYAYIEDQKDKFQDIEEIMSFINSIAPKNQPNEEMIELKQMIKRKEHISFQNRTLNTQALFDDIGWNIVKAKNETKGSLEWTLIESKIRQEEEQKIINARNIDDMEYETLKRKVEGAREKLKHTIKKCFYEGEITSENTHQKPITKQMLKRYRRGDIEKRYQIRDLLKGNIKELDEIWKEKGDINYERYIKDNLQIVFDVFGFTIDDEPKEEITLFAFQIPDEQAEHIFDERNQNALNFLLKEWHDLPISEKSLRLIDENKLRMFSKLAKITDYDCTYVSHTTYNDRLKDLRKYGTETKINKETKKEMIVGKTLTHKMVKDLIKDYIKKSETMSKKLKRDIPLLTQQLKQRNCTKVADYKKNLQIAISENHELLDFEMDFLKLQESHITIKSFKPHYTRFLSTFIRRYPKQELKNKRTKKKSHVETSSIGKDIDEVLSEVYDL